MPQQKDLFLVRRTSLYDEQPCDEQPCDEQPCDEAFKTPVLVVDERSVDCPSKVRFHSGDPDWWYKDGTNHRVENGHIKRDMGYKDQWAVKLCDLVSLMSFIEKYGECVVFIDREGNQSIEIYDAYRE